MSDQFLASNTQPRQSDFVRVVNRGHSPAIHRPLALGYRRRFINMAQNMIDLWRAHIIARPGRCLACWCFAITGLFVAMGAWEHGGVAFLIRTIASLM